MKLCIAVFFALTAATLMGCAKEESSPTKSASGGGAGGAGPAPMSALGRAKNLREVENHLKQFGTIYLGYRTEHNKSPGKLDDLAGDLKADAKLLQAFQDRVYSAVWNAEASSDSVIAHETEPDHNNNHRVVMGDGSLKTMSHQELEAKLKNKNK